MTLDSDVRLSAKSKRGGGADLKLRKKMTKSLLLTSLLALCCRAISEGSFHILYVNSSGENSIDCWRGETQCMTLDYALQGALQYDPVELVLDSVHPHNLTAPATNTTFMWKTGFKLSGTPGPAVVHCGQDPAGLTFLNSNNIDFQDVEFYGCGTLHNSTSTKSVEEGATDFPFYQFSVALYFLFCANVTMRRVNVSNSHGTGVVLYSTVGNNFFEDSNFTQNIPSSDVSGGGGVSVEFVYCVPGDIQCFSSNKPTVLVPANYSQHSVYRFSRCFFCFNYATTVNESSNLYIVPQRNTNIAIGRGGGLALWIKGSASNNSITVEECIVKNNQAVWGGGFLLEIQDSATSNNITISNNSFENNYCKYSPCSYQGTGGGGARIQFANYWNTMSYNSVLVTHSNFTNNTAYFGGGVSFFTFREHKNDSVTGVTNRIEFHTCNWDGNVARLGAAMDLSLWHMITNGSITQPILQDCNFTNNTVEYTKLIGTAVGVGTVYSDSVPIAFSGRTFFVNNSGSALVSLDAEVEFKKELVVFENNTGREGGAIVLFNQAFLLLHQEVELQFLKNRADLKGGAIFWESIGDHQLISSRNCFFRYVDSYAAPSNWNVTLKFYNNTAGLAGNAIYATTLLGCVWGGVPYGTSERPEHDTDTFCWNNDTEPNAKIWDYGDDSCNNSIATDGGSFAGTECGECYNYTVFPGERSVLPVELKDDRLSNVSSNTLIFSLIFENQTENKYVTHGDITIPFNFDDNNVYRVETLPPRVLFSEVHMSFKPCPPGFVNHTNSSTCSEGNYRFIIPQENMTSLIQRGHWIGYYNHTNKTRKLVTAQCFYCPSNPRLNHSSYVLLPQDVEQLQDLLCTPMDRKGYLCSNCMDTLGPAVNAHDHKCISCSAADAKYSWALFIATKFLPTTILLFIICFFNVSVTSGPANAFVFFAQLISSTFEVDGDGTIDYGFVTSAAIPVKRTYTSLYGIWNLNFFDSVGAYYCLSPNLTPLDLFLLEYLTAVYPLVVIIFISIIVHLYDKDCRAVVCVCRPIHQFFARFRRRWNFQRSMMDTFSTFLVLSYTKFTVVSSILLYANPLYDENSNKIATVSYLHGEIDYFSLEYAPYLVTAILVYFGICILIPLVLFLYSFRPFYIFITSHPCLRFLVPGGKFTHFLDSFYHCYQDGGKNDTGPDRRYFASLYFVLRLVLMSTYTLGMTWSQQYLMQQVVCTVALLLFGTLQPYKQKMYNYLDSAVLAILALINVLTLYNRSLDAANSGLSPTGYYFQLLFIFAPMVYITCYMAYFLIYANRDLVARCCCCCFLLKNRIMNVRDVPLENSFAEYIDEVEGERHWFRNSYHGPVRDEDGFFGSDGSSQRPLHNTVAVNVTHGATESERQPLLPNKHGATVIPRPMYSLSSSRFSQRSRRAAFTK